LATETLSHRQRDGRIDTQHAVGEKPLFLAVRQAPGLQPVFDKARRGPGTRRAFTGTR